MSPSARTGRRSPRPAADGTIRLWDVAERIQLGEPLIGHERCGWSVAFSPNGRDARLGRTTDGTIRLWDVAERASRSANPSSATKVRYGASPSARTGRRSPRPARTGRSDSGTSPSASRSGEPLIGHKLRFGASPSARTANARLNRRGRDDQTLERRRAPASSASPSHGHEGTCRASPSARTARRSPQPAWTGQSASGTSPSASQLGEPLVGHDGSRVAASPSARTARRSPRPVRTGRSDSGTSPSASRSASRSSATRAASERRLQPGRRDARLGRPGRDGQTLGRRRAPAAGRAPHRPRAAARSSVAFSPNGETLASAGVDGTIRLWDVAERQPLGEPLNGHEGALLSARLQPDRGDARLGRPRTG